ncbi:MAG: hypothetical protein Unbinned706contig1000_4 [Prokaryotic dsDNA virus sp.]|nr:MAG: hypothetical protein Unbinned706contig1000_4 [Prokaryotic dsDNA virus sp.]|tara:strand:+ start:7155 stop:7670 length:516 start_codon:yes stop_codon:yes gene_type:complete
MSILEWFPLLSESALQLIPARSANSELLAAYLIVSIIIKRASFLAAFFISCMFMEMSLFDPLSEASLYLLTFATYSYVISCNALTFYQKLACGIILILSITLAYDAYFYGMDGIYGAHETIVYNNIEYLALYAHIIFICSLIPYRRIGDSIRHCVNSIVHYTRNSAYFVIC